MDFTKIIERLTELEDPDKAVLAKTEITEALQSLSEEYNRMNERVITLADQNAKLAMRITSKVEEPEEKTEEEVEKEELEKGLNDIKEKYKDFI